MFYSFTGSRKVGMQKVNRRLIVVCYAGFEAQRRYNPQATNDYSDPDNADAFSLSREPGVAPKWIGRIGSPAHDKYLDSMRSKARDLVNRNWTAVVAVANALLKQKQKMLVESDVKLICSNMHMWSPF
jgi:hypothetical protein